MAAGRSAAKENAAPSPSASEATASAAAAASSRRHAYAVKSCGVKKRPFRPRILRRVPLRDITNLIVASSAAEVSPAAAAELTRPDAVLPLPAVRMAALQDGDAAGAGAGPAAKAARGLILRKGFR